MIGTNIKEVIAQGRAIKSVYYGATLIWTKIKEVITSCYGNGKWIGNYRWINNDKWKSK